jgi:hypothetical protein
VGERYSIWPELSAALVAAVDSPKHPPLLKIIHCVVQPVAPPMHTFSWQEIWQPGGEVG